jgi:hypothetical protein
MTDISELLHWGWMLAFAVIGYFLKDFHAKVKDHAVHIRQLELDVQKQGTENDALFKRMDDVREALRDLNTKLDSLIMTQKRRD